VLGQVLLLAAIVFVVLRVRSLWRGGHIVVGSVDWTLIAGALVFALVGVVGTGFIWLGILERLGASTRRQWVAIFFQAQLAKYIPGTLWQYAGRLTLARRRNLPGRAVVRSMPVELGASLGGAGIACLLLLGYWGVPVAITAAAACSAVGFSIPTLRKGLSRELSATAMVTPSYAAVWVVMGASFWLTARALLPVPPSQLPFYTGAFAAAWIVGVVAVYAPGGIGVREGLLVALLHSRLGPADALVVAAASRILLTLTDVVVAGAAFLVLRRDHPSISEGPEERPRALDPQKSIMS